MNIKEIKHGWEKCPDDNAEAYISKCELFSKSDSHFANFRRDPDYGKILEGGEEIVGEMALKSIAKLDLPVLLKNLARFKENDIYGNPILRHYKLTGEISPTTLRYVNNCLEIKKLIKDFEPKKIVEVGGGYGGLCKTMSVLYAFDEYILIDLPPVIELCKKYLDNFSDIKEKITYVYCDNLEEIEKIKNTDLFISDSAFAECDLATQKIYTKIAVNSKFVYVTFNALHIGNADQEMKIFMNSFGSRRVNSYQSWDKTVVTVQ